MVCDSFSKSKFATELLSEDRQRSAFFFLDSDLFQLNVPLLAHLLQLWSSELQTPEKKKTLLKLTATNFKMCLHQFCWEAVSTNTKK